MKFSFRFFFSIQKLFVIFMTGIVHFLQELMKKGVGYILTRLLGHSDSEVVKNAVWSFMVSFILYVPGSLNGLCDFHPYNGSLEFDPERIRASSWMQKHIFGYGKWKFWLDVDEVESHRRCSRHGTMPGKSTVDWLIACLQLLPFSSRD